MRLRRAELADTAALTALAIEAKASWGYDAGFMARCRDALTVDAATLAAGETWLAETLDGKPAGFFDLRVRDRRAEAESFFVAPESHNTGIGAALWAHLETRAKALGAAMVFVDADPNAVGFYQRMGLVLAGEVPSDVEPGRSLPRLTRSFSKS